MKKLISLYVLKALLLSIVFVLPVQAGESRKSYGEKVINVQGVVESKGREAVVISGIKYKVAPYAKIREGETPIRIRHLVIGTDVEFDYKVRAKNKPLITSISVMMK